MALLFLGDFLYDYDNVQEDIRKISNWIKEQGYKVVLNLEGPVTENFSQRRKKRGPNLYQNKRAIEMLKELQVVGVCLSNNHMMDFGSIGLVDTIKLLDENGILHTGAGVNLLEASRPMIIKDGAEIYEIYNFGWNLEETVYAGKRKAGCSPREEEYILKYIGKKWEKKSIKMAVMHWGFEYNYLPMPYDIELAHKMLDGDFDIIIGHHPHVVQPKEKYENKMIFYSIGNFYMGTRRKLFYERLKNEVLGIGILLEREKYEQFDVKYDMQGTCISTNTYEKDITDVNFESRTYFNKCKSNSLNYTPILTNNRLMNLIKITCLKIFYTIYKIIRPFRKSKKRMRNG